MCLYHCVYTAVLQFIPLCFLLLVSSCLSSCLFTYTRGRLVYTSCLYIMFITCSHHFVGITVHLSIPKRRNLVISQSISQTLLYSAAISTVHISSQTFCRLFYTVLTVLLSIFGIRRDAVSVVPTNQEGRTRRDEWDEGLLEWLRH